MNPEEIDPHLTAKIVQSYVKHHRLGPDQLADLITSVHRAIGQLGRPPEPDGVLIPPVSVRRSVHRDYVTCLDCGYRGGRVPLNGVGAVGKWSAVATAMSLAEAGHLSTAVVIVSLG